MTPLTQEWISKAEADFRSARREYRARKEPNYDLACFLAQQVAEKYLKARLQEAGVPFAKTHNLAVLLDLLLPVEPLWEGLRPMLKALTGYAVEVRYPGASADKERAKTALLMAEEVRGFARRGLGVE